MEYNLYKLWLTRLYTWNIYFLQTLNFLFCIGTYLTNNVVVFLRWMEKELCLMHQFSSVAQLCLTLCDPMDCSMPGFPVHHQLLEPAQTHVHWVSDAIQPSHPLPYVYMYPFSPKPPSHPGWYITEQSFMCYAVSPCWFSILIMAACTRLSQTPLLSLPPSNHKFIF